MKVWHEFLDGGTWITFREEVDHGPLHKFCQGSLSFSTASIWELQPCDVFEARTSMFGVCRNFQSSNQGLVWWTAVPQSIWLCSCLHLFLSKMWEKWHELRADVHIPAKIETSSQRTDVKFVKMFTARSLHRKRVIRYIYLLATKVRKRIWMISIQY